MNWDLEFLDEEQNWLAHQVHILDKNIDFAPTDILFGIDIQYVDEMAFVAIAVYQFNGQYIDTFVYQTVTGMEYIPGYFCFREGPPILRTIRKVLSKKNIIPKLIVIDGHGLAHPRKLGVACFIGLKTNIPTIGIAKRTLLQYEGTLAKERGSTLPIYIKNEKVGVVLRTQTNVKPVFVSPGYKISPPQATEIALKISDEYRISSPIRKADHAARNLAKGQQTDSYKTL